MKYIKLAPGLVLVLSACGDGGSVTGVKQEAKSIDVAAPRIIEVASADKSLVVTFQEPSVSGAVITGYQLSLDTGSVWTLAPLTEANQLRVSGLTNGVGYSVAIRAVTSTGSGEISSRVHGIPMTFPGAPSITSLKGETERLRVSFAAPVENGGDPALSYEYTLDGGKSWSAADSLTGSTFLILRLEERREYVVAIRAVNKAGRSAASSAEKAFVATVADQPTGVSAVPSDGRISLTFVAPAFTGGKDILSYEYSIDSGFTWKSSGSTATSILVTGVVNGTRYQVAVRAVTESGAGHSSVVVAAVPFVVAPEVVLVRASRKAGTSYYIPQRLDMLGTEFTQDALRALERYRALNGRDAVTLFERVQAAADYVANMAKHPYRHTMNSEVSDPRAWEFADFPEKLAELAKENQSWDGVSWAPAAGKTLLDVPPLECTFQNLILGGIVNTLGAQWMIVSISHHDAFAYYDAELGKWIYIDATFNEDYRSPFSSASSYVPLSPFELREMSLRGDNSMLAVQHNYQPVRQDFGYDFLPYVSMNPLGFDAMAVSVNGVSIGSRNSTAQEVRVLAGGKSEVDFAANISMGWVVAADDEDIFAPQGETFLESVEVTPRGNVIHLSTNLAVAAPSFERSVNGGPWTSVAQNSEIDGLTGEIRFRAKFLGFTGGELIIRQAAK